SDFGVQQPPFERERLSKMRAFRAETAAVGRVVGVAGDLYRALLGDGGRDSTADPAIGASGADRRHEGPPFVRRAGAEKDREEHRSSLPVKERAAFMLPPPAVPAGPPLRAADRFARRRP